MDKKDMKESITTSARGRKLLEDYLQLKNMTQAEFSRKCNMDFREIYYLISGRRRASMRQAAIIAKSTHNKVPMQSWVDDV